MPSHHFVAAPLWHCDAHCLYLMCREAAQTTQSCMKVQRLACRQHEQFFCRLCSEDRTISDNFSSA